MNGSFYNNKLTILIHDLYLDIAALVFSFVDFMAH